MNQYIAHYPKKFGPSPNPNNGLRAAVEALEEGDFFLMDLPESTAHGIPNHARLIVGWGYPEEGDNLEQWSLLINQHCTDRKRVRWDYRLDFATTPIWVYHVIP